MRNRYLRRLTFITGQGLPLTRITSPKKRRLAVVVEQQWPSSSNIVSLSTSGTS